MKITVINLKKIIKYIFIFFVITIIFILLVKSLNTDKKREQREDRISLLQCMKYELPITRVVKENISRAGSRSRTTTRRIYRARRTRRNKVRTTRFRK